MPNSASSRTSGRELPVEVVADLVKQICLTFSEVSLYSWDHPAPRKHLENTWTHLSAALEKYGDISIHMADGKLLFGGMALEEKNPVVHRLSNHLESINVHSLTFGKGMRKEELDGFFHVFSMEKPEIEAGGGVANILIEKGMTHLRTNAAIYKLITEDEKVVSADSVVIDRLQDKGDVDNEIVRYFTREVLQKTGNQDELINRMKNNPQELATQIVTLLAHVDTAHADVQKHELMNALMTNIELVGKSVAQGEGVDLAEQENMARAMATLEMELERKGKKLSSAGSVKFLKQITNIVASYSDTSRAEAILNEYVENQRSFASAEAMLAEISGDADTSQRLLERMKKVMDKRHVQAEELLDLIEQSEEVKKPEPVEEKPKKKPAPPRKKAKRVSKTFRPVAERIKPKIRAAIKGKLSEKELITYLDGMFRRELGRRVRDAVKHSGEAPSADASLSTVETASPAVAPLVQDAVLGSVRTMLGHTEIGLIVLDQDEKVVFWVNGEAVADIEVGRVLPKTLALACHEFTPDIIMAYEGIHVLHVDREENGTTRAIMFIPATEEVREAEAEAGPKSSEEIKELEQDIYVDDEKTLEKNSPASAPPLSEEAVVEESVPVACPLPQPEQEATDIVPETKVRAQNAIDTIDDILADIKDEVEDEEMD